MQLPTILLAFSILTSRLPHRSCTGICPAAAQEVKQKLFQKLPFDDFVGTTETHTKETAASDVDCAGQCDRTDGCAMFTFLPSQNVLSGECWMYQQLVNSTVGWEHRAGAENYGWKEEDGSQEVDGQGGELNNRINRIHFNTGLNMTSRVSWQPCIWDCSAMTCVDGYVLTCDRCLKYVKSRKTFSEAKDTCEGQDQGHLVVAKSVDDLTCFKSFAASNGGTLGGKWLGADDLAEEGKFVWHDGTILPVDSSMWVPREPDGDVNENCVRLTLSSARLQDYPCDKRFEFMCQTEPN